MSEKTKDEKLFKPKKITIDDINTNYRHDLSALYESAHSELTLQQTKRDKIITLYLSVFSLLIPIAFSIEGLTEISRALIFYAIGVIGVIFSIIAIRYRVYKEVYWLCCETITCLMNVKEEKLDKDIVQSLYYKCLKKKGTGFFKNGKWSVFTYFKKNVFSSETLHYIVIDFLTSVLWGVGTFLVLPFENGYNIIIAVALSFTISVLLIILYFYHCNSVYAVLRTNRDAEFNKVFGKAWFLHLYVDLSDEENSAYSQK